MTLALLQENDQLRQDKQEMIDMIAYLTHELKVIEQKNQNLQQVLDNLKRWIAKRARELQLADHLWQEWEDTCSVGIDNSDAAESCGPLLHGDPSLHSTAAVEYVPASSELILQNTIHQDPVVINTPVKHKQSGHAQSDQITFQESTKDMPVHVGVQQVFQHLDERVIEIPDFGETQQMIVLENGNVILVQNGLVHGAPDQNEVVLETVQVAEDMLKESSVEKPMKSTNMDSLIENHSDSRNVEHTLVTTTESVSSVQEGIHL